MINRKDIERQITDYYQDCVNGEAENQYTVEYLWERFVEEFGYSNIYNVIEAIESPEGEKRCMTIKKFELMNMAFIVGYMLGRVHADD